MSAQPLSQQISTPPHTHTARGLIAVAALLLSVFLFSASAQADSHEDFVTTWVMPEGGDRVLTFPGTGTYTLDCGPGGTAGPVGSSSPTTCTYTSSGTYEVRASKGITRFNLANGEDKEKLTDVAQWGAAVWTTMNGAFQGASALRTMSAMDKPDLTIVTDMSLMFADATAFNQDLNSWNVSSVTNMNAMFFSTNLNVFNGDISSWNVSKVTDMSNMFSGAAAFDQDIGNWDVSSVTLMGSVFNAAAAFDQDITRWDVSKVTLMFNMFNAAVAFNQDISNWDVSKVTNMQFMFSGAPATAFNQNLGRWYVTDRVASTTPTLRAQNPVLIGQTKTYTLADGNGGADNGLFTLGAGDVLSLTEADPATRTYSLRIGITGTGRPGQDRFGTKNEVAIIVTSSDSDEGTRVYAISVPRNLGQTAAAEAQVLNAILPQLFKATTKMTVDNISNRIDQALDASASTDTSLNLGGSSTLQELINNNARTALQDGLDIKQMLNNSSFLIPLNVAGDNNYGANNMTLWGSGDYLNLSDDASGVDWEGEIVGGSVGIDARLSRNLVAGAAVSYSEGDIDYKRDDENDSANNSKGTLTNTLYSVHPYLGYDLSQGGRVWGTLGYGQGEVEISDKINTVETKSSRDTELYSLAFGGSGDLLSSNSWLNMSGTTTLRLKGEVSLSNIKVDKGNLANAKALSIDAHRYRMALEGSHKQTLASGASISPSVELGIRYDDGSGETGGGVELAGSYRYSNPQGLEMELRAHGLLAHESNYKEWGLSGLVKYQASSSGQGLWLSLQPAWGDTPSNVADRIWQPAAVTDYANDEDSNDSRSLQLNTELGYGLPGFFGRGLLTPYAGLNMTNDTQGYNIGARWAIDSRLNLDLIGEHKQTDDSIQLRVDLKF